VGLYFICFLVKNIFGILFLQTQHYHWPTHIGPIVIAIRGKRGLMPPDTHTHTLKTKKQKQKKVTKNNQKDKKG